MIALKRYAKAMQAGVALIAGFLETCGLTGDLTDRQAHRACEEGQEQLESAAHRPVAQDRLVHGPDARRCAPTTDRSKTPAAGLSKAKKKLVDQKPVTEAPVVR
jgi:hypothetical protein